VPPEHGKGKGEAFSKTFVEPFKDTALATSMTKSRFMKELDGRG